MAKNEIRFIDSGYNELFRIKDGESITVKYNDGNIENMVCKYIDDYHAYIGINCFHMCEWAELMERNGNTFEPADKPFYKLQETTQDEHEYMYSPVKPEKISRGCIGYLRADFDTGKLFYYTWFNIESDLKTDEFRSELDDIINYFRESSSVPLLKSRGEMARICRESKTVTYTQSGINNSFKVTTEKHTYYFRCNPGEGNYDVYIYCYNTTELDKYKEMRVNQKTSKETDKSHQEKYKNVKEAER